MFAKNLNNEISADVGLCWRNYCTKLKFILAELEMIVVYWFCVEFFLTEFKRNIKSKTIVFFLKHR